MRRVVAAVVVIVLLVVVAAVAVVFRSEDAAKVPGFEPAEAHVLGGYDAARAEAATLFRIRTSDAQTTLDRSNGTWRVRELAGMSVDDPGRVDRLLDAITELRVSHRFVGAAHENPTAAAVAEAGKPGSRLDRVARLTVLGSDDARLADVFLSAPVSVPGTMEDSQFIVREHGSQEIWLASLPIGLPPAAPLSWVDPRLLHVPEVRVSAIELAVKEGHLRLERDGSNWRRSAVGGEGLSGLELDQDTIHAMVSAIESLQIQGALAADRFVAPPGSRWLASIWRFDNGARLSLDLNQSEAGLWAQAKVLDPGEPEPGFDLAGFNEQHADRYYRLSPLIEARLMQPLTP